MGCSAKPENIQAWAKPYETNVTADRYVVQPPDELELRCAQVPEVNLQRQRVRPDGKISFEILGDFDVAGKTPEEIAADVGKRVKEHYNAGGRAHRWMSASPSLPVTSTTSLGQVTRPGPRNFSGRDRTLTAVAEAQPNSLAWQRVIQVVRPAAEEGAEPLVFSHRFQEDDCHGETPARTSSCKTAISSTFRRPCWRRSGW